MSPQSDRRNFIKGSLLAPAAAALSLRGVAGAAEAETPKMPTNTLPCGKIGDLTVSRMLLGGNLLTHFTHSRDLQYVYNLTAQYNTDEKIVETMRLAEANGVNTLSVHTVPRVMSLLKRYRYEMGGKMQYIVCPTAPLDDTMDAYKKSVTELVDNGTDAIYLWGVRGDQLVEQNRIDLIKKAVDIAKEHGVPSGVGAHDLRVIDACEKNGVEADFYIKTFHHHRYPSGPKPEEITGPHNENPGYWCQDPDAVIKTMADVKRPWIAFKIMAAGAIPPQDAFQYAFENGADHLLVGMFDFELVQDVEIAKKALADAQAKRTRTWMS